MERLTELKLSDKIPLAVLYEWSKLGNYCNGGYESYQGSILEFKVLMKPDADNNLQLESVATSPYSSPYFHVYDNKSWTQFKLTGFIEFYNKFYNLDTQPLGKPIGIMGTKIWVGDDKELRLKVFNRLIELGARDTNIIVNNIRAAIYVYSSGSLAHTDDYNFFLKEDSYVVLNIDQLIIKTNNTPLNTKTDGKSIILRSPVKTITGRQRPEGTSISGKTRPTTVRIGHLNHRAINS